MNKQQTTEERLWDYLDGVSSPGERTVVEQLIQTDLEWKSKYNELLEVQQLLQSTELEAPSMRFTKNVMEEIAKLQIAPATRNYINKRIIWGIGAFFITIIIGFLVYGFGQIDWTVQGNSKLPVDLTNVDFSKIDYSKMFNNNLVNGFMMLNVILGLFLLDRYLANKRKKFHEDA